MKTHEQKKQEIAALFEEIGRDVVIARMVKPDGGQYTRGSITRAVYNGHIPTVWKDALEKLAKRKLDGDLFGMVRLRK